MQLNTQSLMEGRKCIVYLPNDRRLDLTVHGKQLGKELWKYIVSELRLREQDYFGLKYKTSGEHYAWIQDDKRVLDHDIEMKSTDFPLEFMFSVKFYEDSVTVHKHPSTVERIFLHAQNVMYNGEMYVPCDLSLELSAIALQAFYGDFQSEETACSNFRKLSCLSPSVIHELPSVEYCEEQVISWYKNLCGISRGQAVLLFMSKVEKLPSYGVHFFKVKDKARVPWWLGICNKGIYQYRHDNKITPHLVFQWRNLENLYFREKKFSVEVCSGHKRALSTGSATTDSVEKTKKNGNSNQPPKTHTWYGSPALIKSIWIMAIAQHQFYWDRKQSLKSKSQASKTNASNLRIAIDRNPNSLLVPPTEDRGGIMQRKGNRKHTEPQTRMAKKIPLKSQHDVQQSPEVKALEQKMVGDLKKRKLDLEDRLYNKVQELKEICQQEYDITERLPIEYLRYILPGEARPVPKKHVGATYPVRLRDHSARAGGSRNDLAAARELQKLESECDLLNQITKAAYQLAYDQPSKGKVKRNRLQSYQKSLKKLQDVENRVDDLRKKQGQAAAFRQSTLITTSDLNIMAAMKECSIDEKSERSSLSDAVILEDEASISSGAEALSTHSTPALSLRPGPQSADVDLGDVPLQRSRTPPPTNSRIAWLESPRARMMKNDRLSPVNRYPVHPSPTSYRSATSHSSGNDTPPLQSNSREWGQQRWEHAKKHEGWKVSSLDSLESIGSRKSNEHGRGSPDKKKVGNGEMPNSNASKIARATKSHSHFQKVSLREKHSVVEPSRRQGTVNPVVEIVRDTDPDKSKDSRTSLTDSGHGTDSRVQSYHEDEISRKNGGHTIRRDVSDSSLSELSTQSNPAVLPSSGMIPKFVPYFMTTRGRSATHGQTPALAKVDDKEESHTRKRSSSFTELGSTLKRPGSRTDTMRTLTRSVTCEDSNSAVASLPNGQNPGQDGTVSGELQLSLAKNQTEPTLQPPMFDTNLNICKQYLSGSQGQLAQSNPSPVQTPPPEEHSFSGRQFVSEASDCHPSAMIIAANAGRLVHNVSNNNSNNKLNFGQIYKLSQGHTTQNYPRLPHQYQERAHTPADTVSSNVPKCSSLDSILGRGCVPDPAVCPDVLNDHGPQREHYAQNHHIQYPHHIPYKNTSIRSITPQVGTQGQIMTNHDRDRYSNEAFEDVRCMSWVPSLDEYGSRASVAESLPAKSKKEDIREMLQLHFQHRPQQPAVASAVKSKQDRKLQAKIRNEMIKVQESQNNHPDGVLKSSSAVNTWEGYKNNLTLKRKENQGVVYKTSKQSGVDIFAHKRPPAPQQQTQGNYTEAPDTTSVYPSGTIRKGYTDDQDYVIPMPITDHKPTHPLFPNDPDYATIRSQKSIQNYPVVTGSYESGFFSATLPRKHGTRETLPQNSSLVGAICNVPVQNVGNCHRTYSTPSGGSLQDPKFHPSTKYPHHRHQRSADSLLSTAPSFTSPPHSFPAADQRTHKPTSHARLPQPQNLQQGQANYYYQGHIQQRSSSETWKPPQNLVAVNIHPHHHPAAQGQYHYMPPQQQQHHRHVYHQPAGHHQVVDPRTNHDHPRRTASAEDLLWPVKDGRDPSANLNLRAKQGTLV